MAILCPIFANVSDSKFETFSEEPVSRFLKSVLNYPQYNFSFLNGDIVSNHDTCFSLLQGFLEITDYRTTDHGTTELIGEE